jgi:hypothetical protein
MSAYNTFMKEELPKYKAKNVGVDHKVNIVITAQTREKTPQQPANMQDPNAYNRPLSTYRINGEVYTKMHEHATSPTARPYNTRYKEEI